MSIHICNISQSRESPLRTPLRGYGSETWALIHFTRSLRQDWSTLVPLTPYQAWHLGFEDDLRLRRYLASWNIPSPCRLSSILSPLITKCYLGKARWSEDAMSGVATLLLSNLYNVLLLAAIYLCHLYGSFFFSFQKRALLPIFKRRISLQMTGYSSWVRVTFS